MSFEKDKKVALKRMADFDRSDKGSIDKHVKELVDKINSMKNYYTTSSCSGRIVLMAIPKNGCKKDAEFLFRTHEKVTLEKVLEELSNVESEIVVWLRQQAAILHVGAKTIEGADKFLKIARKIGFKRSGMFEFKKRFLIELISTDSMDVPVMKKAELLVSENYIKTLVDEGNRKLRRTWNKIGKLNKSLSTLE